MCRITILWKCVTHEIRYSMHFTGYFLSQSRTASKLYQFTYLKTNMCNTFLLILISENLIKLNSRTDFFRTSGWFLIFVWIWDLHLLGLGGKCLIFFRDFGIQPLFSPSQKFGMTYLRPLSLIFHQTMLRKNLEKKIILNLFKNCKS